MTCVGEILQLPLPTILDAYFRFLTTPGVRRGKNAFSPPHIGVIALSSAGSRVAITGGTLFHGQGNRQSKHHHPRAPQDFPQPLLYIPAIGHIIRYPIVRPQVPWQAGGPVSQSKESQRWRSTRSYGEGSGAFQRQTRSSAQ